MFLFTEGLRKYFGAEIQMERPWGINRFPFLDDEFVEFAFRAPFAGVYSRTLHPTVANRFQSQYFYAYIIRKYRPKLLNALTDHGYAPRDVISPLALWRIGPQFLVPALASPAHRLPRIQDRGVDGKAVPATSVPDGPAGRSIHWQDGKGFPEWQLERDAVGFCQSSFVEVVVRIAGRSEPSSGN